MPMILRRIHHVLLFALCLGTIPGYMQAMPQEDEPINGIIGYDYVWEYLTGPHNHELLHYGFTGEKEVDGVSYHVFECIEGYDYNGTPLDLSSPPYSMEYLLRDDPSSGKVWACVTGGNPGFVETSEVSHKEILIYDFSQKAGEDYTPWLWNGAFGSSFSGSWGEPIAEVGHDKPVYYTVGEGEPMEIEGRLARVIKILYPDTDNKNKTLVEGIGCISGGILPVIPTDFYSGYGEFAMSRVLDEKREAVYEDREIFGDDNVIRQWIERILSGVDAVSADGHTAPSDRIYDLQGRELRSPIPGQPYIQGGKIHSGRKHE